MSSAAVRNFGLAQRERGRRVAASLDDPGGPLAVTGDPAGDAFWGALNEKAAAANAAGMGFRADLSGIGRFGDGGFSMAGGLTPQQRAGIAGNVALGEYTDQAHAASRANDLMGAQAAMATQGRIDAGQQDIDQQAIDSAQQVADQSGDLTDQQRRDLFLRSIPGHLRPAVEARIASMDQQRASTAATNAGTAATNAKTAIETGLGSLPDYLARVAAAKGKAAKDLTPQEVDDARGQYLNTAAMSTVQGPKVQQALEQQYRGVLQKELSSRSGGLGIEDQKVNQAIHLIALMEQNKDPRTGQYTIPKAQYAELASGLATLVSPNGRPTDSMRNEIEQRTAAGDLAGLGTYLTGKPFTGSSQDIFKLLRDSIERQGSVAESNRQKYLDALRAQAPTDLAPTRRAALEQSLRLNSLNAPAGAVATAAAQAPAAATGGTVRLKAPDGSIRDVPAALSDHYRSLGAEVVR